MMAPSLFLTDTEFAQLERDPVARNYLTSCPVCRSTGEYVHKGVVHECPDDDYGHMMQRLAQRYWLANIGRQYQTLDWDDYPHPEVKADIEAFIDKYEFLRLEGVGITFYSKTTGVGKTWGATHVLKELVKQGVDGWFVPFWEIPGYIKIEDYEERAFKIGKVRDSELVVIDDVQQPYSDRQNDFFADKLEEVIRPRTDKNLPTIITTNMTAIQLEDYYPRIFSLLHAKNQLIELKGFDARRAGIIYQQNVEAAFQGETRPVT